MHLLEYVFTWISMLSMVSFPYIYSTLFKFVYYLLYARSSSGYSRCKSKWDSLPPSLHLLLVKTGGGSPSSSVRITSIAVIPGGLRNSEDSGPVSQQSQLLCYLAIPSKRDTFFFFFLEWFIWSQTGSRDWALESHYVLFHLICLKLWNHGTLTPSLCGRNFKVR